MWLTQSETAVIDSQGKFQLLLADGIDAAIEVKPDLTEKGELHRGLKQCVSVKALRRKSSPIIFPHHNPVHIVEFSRQIPFFLYADRAKKLDALLTDITDYYITNSTPIEDQVDYIAINDVGMVVNVKYAERFPWSLELKDHEKPGWYFEQWGEDTLAGLLLAIESTFHSRPDVDERVLAPYVQQFTRQVYRLNPVPDEEFAS